MTLTRRHFSGICARLAAALHVLAVALVLLLPLGHAAWAVESGRQDVAVTVQTPESGETPSYDEADLLCCGHASCHLQAEVVFGSSVEPLTSTDQEILRPVADDTAASRALHPPRKPPRLV